MKFFRKKYTHLSDETLVSLIKRKDESAFEELYHRYSKKLQFYFLKMLNGDKEQAEDLFQDIFLKIISRPYLIDETRKFSTWVYSVSYNACKNIYRKTDRFPEVPYEDDDEIQPHYNDIELNTDLNDFKEDLNNKLTLMNEEHKTTFLLRYVYDLSIAEVAEVMECSEGTVKSRLFYTLKKLQTKLKKYEIINRPI